jgi:hypothetical protein
MASYEECNALKPIMRGHDNQRELVAAKTEDTSEIRYQAKLSGLVVSSGQTWASEKTIKYSGRPRRLKEPSSSSNPQSDITSEEHLKILLRILPKTTFTITSLLHTSEFQMYIYLETIKETYGPRSPRPHIRRTVSLVRGNEEYLWAALGITLGRVSWHHVRRLQICFDGSITFRGTYRYVSLSPSGRKRGLFLEGSLVEGQEVES